MRVVWRNTSPSIFLAVSSNTCKVAFALRLTGLSFQRTRKQNIVPSGVVCEIIDGLKN